MGDPRRLKKKYKGPGHPWQRSRIGEERILKKNYGLKNKKEIWRAASELRRINIQVKKLIRERGKGSVQTIKEEKQLLERLYNYGLIQSDSKLEDVLNLSTKNILDRRLQAIVFKQGFSLTSKQARQFIVHGCILVDGKKINVPSYFVSRDEEFKIGFNPGSGLSSENHPEREKRTQAREAAEKKNRVEIVEVAEADMTEEQLEKVEKEIGEVVVEV